MPRAKRKFYGRRRKPEPQTARPADLDLDGAAALAGLEQEIPLLRALVKRAVQTDKHGEARRLVLALCGALRLQQSLAGQSAAEARQMLEELLDKVDLEEEPASISEEGRP